MPVRKPPQVSRRYGLVHHSHTGRRLHRRHTSYPLVALLLLAIGVFLSVLTMQVRAVDVVVQAAVNGDPPTVPAVIVSPVADARFGAPTVPVSGTCDPNFFVKIYRNDIFAGSSECSPAGEFSVTIQLFPGRNDLVARTFNVAELEGPTSNTVVVYYDAPVPAQGSPFYLTTDYFFRAAYTGQRIVWDFGITGGSPPYQVTVTWGDGSTDTITNVTGKSFRLEHLYRSSANQREFFTVTVTVTDGMGASTLLQLVAIMNDPDIVGASFAEPKDPTLAVTSPDTLRLLWLAFALVALMGTCFYLGERRGQAVTDTWYRQHPAR